MFDTEVSFQAGHVGLPVVDAPVTTRYFADASSVGFGTKVLYGLGRLWTAARFLLHRWAVVGCDGFRHKARRADSDQLSADRRSHR